MTSSDPGHLTETFRTWWWTHLGNRDLAQCRARAARLCRAEVLTVLADPAVHDLARILDVGPGSADRLVRAVRAMAEVRGTGMPFARALGNGDPPNLSEHRFERLIRSNPDEIGTSVRRALPLIERVCDPGRLAADLFFWTERTRITWTFQYFAAPLPEHMTKETLEIPTP